MSVYSKQFADLYDLMYEDKPYEQEVSTIESLLGRHGLGPSARLLDLACGTGKHSCLFAQRGWDVIGVDLSADMLAEARSRASDRGVDVRFEQQDMRSLSLDGTFDAVVCLFDAIGYAVSDEGVADTLISVRDLLKPGGVFVFEMWHAPAMLKRHDPVRVKRWTSSEGARVVRVSETVLDEMTSTCDIRFSLFEEKPEGDFGLCEEVHRNRFFTVSEMDAFLRAANLTPLSWHPGFILEGQVADDTWHVLGVAGRS